MRVVVQRVSEASVEVDGRTVAGIGRGLLLLVGIEKGDGEREIEFMAEKVLHLRIFADDRRKNEPRASGRSAARSFPFRSSPWRRATKKGAAPISPTPRSPEKPKRCTRASTPCWPRPCRSPPAIFGAMMDVHSVNHGPVTIILEKSAPILKVKVKRKKVKVENPIDQIQTKFFHFGRMSLFDMGIAKN